MRLKIIKSISIVCSLVVCLWPLVSVGVTNIDATDKYAWSNMSGWINFGLTNVGVVVSDTVLTGYAWSANHGWIKLDPAAGGVTNDIYGNLSGNAWGEGLGWIDFSGVKINSAGKFTGQATGDLVGTINFDCDHCAVVTSWLPQAEPSPAVTEVDTDSGSKVSRILDWGKWFPQYFGWQSSAPVDTAILLPAGCQPYLTEYIKQGAKNNPAEVIKLQRFLSLYEGFTEVAVTGTYDQVTKEAVVKFQQRYAGDVLREWGLERGTGYVYKTTVYAINKRYCQAMAFYAYQDEIWLTTALPGSHQRLLQVEDRLFRQKPNLFFGGDSANNEKIVWWKILLFIILKPLWWLWSLLSAILVQCSTWLGAWFN